MGRQAGQPVLQGLQVAPRGGRKVLCEKVEFVLHPQTLEVLSQVGRSGGTVGGQPGLAAAQISQSLQQAVYTRVRSVEHDDGFWEAEATNTAGQSVELRLDPHTGRVLSERLDD